MEEILNMLVEKNILKSDLLYSDDKSRRYLLHLEWDKTKKKACVIMLSAGKSNGIYFDRSTNNVVTNLVESDYGSVDILNLFSSLDDKIEQSSDKDNLKAIDTSAKESDIVIFAAGTGHSTNKKAMTRQNEVLAILKKHDKNLYCIADDEGKKFYHPLCPKAKKWNLVKFDIAELTKKGYEE